MQRLGSPPEGASGRPDAGQDVRWWTWAGFRANATLAAISEIPETAWTPIKYRAAVWDEEESRWVSEAEIAKVRYTAFASRAKGLQVTARLIVRRVKRLNPATRKSPLPAKQRHRSRHHKTRELKPARWIEAQVRRRASG